MQQVMGLIAGHTCANDIVHSKHMNTRQTDSCTGHTHYMPCMLELHTRCYYNNGIIYIAKHELQRRVF